MISAVLDANVLASGFVGFAIKQSTPGELLRRWRQGAFELVTSEPIIDEFAGAMAKPYFVKRLSAERRTADVALIRQEAREVALTQPVIGVASDPHDDRVLSTAVSAAAQYVVTGDKPLQDVGAYQGVQIVSPRAFLEILASGVAE